MKVLRFRATRPVSQLAADTSGATLVEFGVVLPLFLLFVFGMIDFGRMGFEYVLANKAVQLAARTAVVRPAACNGVPAINIRGAVINGVEPPIFGTNCRAGATVCAAPAVVQCTGNTANATVNEIWGSVSNLMPTGSSAENLSFSYAYTPDLGFLGGPYVPMVTVEITGFDFQFITPLAALAVVAGGGTVTDPEQPGSVPFPPLGVTLPAEDLNQGNAG